MEIPHFFFLAPLPLLSATGPRCPLPSYPQTLVLAGHLPLHPPTLLDAAMPNAFYRLLSTLPPRHQALPFMTTPTHAAMVHGPCPCEVIAVKSEQNDAALVVTRQCPSPMSPG